jgi:hypothetical protein
MISFSLLGENLDVYIICLEFIILELPCFPMHFLLS